MDVRTRQAVLPETEIGSAKPNPRQHGRDAVGKAGRAGDIHAEQSPGGKGMLTGVQRSVHVRDVLKNVVEAYDICTLFLTDNRWEVTVPDGEPLRAGVLDHLCLGLNAFGAHPAASRCIEEPTVRASDIE